MIETIHRVTNAEKELTQRLGRQPTIEEITEELGGQAAGFTTRKVANIKRIHIDPVSLDKTVGSDEDSQISDFVKEDVLTSPVQYTKESLLKEDINQLFKVTLTPEEENDFFKILNTIFDMKDYEPEKQEEEKQDETLNSVIEKELQNYKFGNKLFEDKIKLIFKSLPNKNKFILFGPPLCGKSELMRIITKISQQLNDAAPEAYKKIFTMKIYPKSKDPKEVFSYNNLKHKYQFNNNFFFNMLSTFKFENREVLEKYNMNYLNDKKQSLWEMIQLQKLQKQNQKSQTAEGEEDELENKEDLRLVNQLVERENLNKCIVFDGSIDNKWIEYLNNVYTDCDHITHPFNSTTSMKDWKIFYETTSIKHASPSFITKQFLIHFENKTFSWENILYPYIETDPKVNENTDLKNYLRGLFENFYPRVWDFVQNNRNPNLSISENRTIKCLIDILSFFKSISI